MTELPEYQPHRFSPWWVSGYGVVCAICGRKRKAHQPTELEDAK